MNEEEPCEDCVDLPEHSDDDSYVENPSAVDDWIDPADLEDHEAAAAEDLDDDDVTDEEPVDWDGGDIPEEDRP